MVDKNKNITAEPVVPEKNKEPTYLGSEIVKAFAGSDGDIFSIILKPKERYSEKGYKKLLEDFKKKEIKPNTKKKEIKPNTDKEEA